MSTLGVIGYFFFNHNYIVTELCVQRDSVENTCQGCCFLSEKINLNNPNESESVPNEVEVKIPQLTLFFQKVASFNPVEYLVSYRVIQEVLHPTLTIATIFKPPIY
jgi:hypothetical protein